MKRIIILILCFYSYTIHGQLQNKSPMFSSSEFAVYGGINFNTPTETAGSFLIEYRTNLINSLNLKLSLGYSNSFQLDSYTVKTYGKVIIDSIIFHQAVEYDVKKIGYDILPIAFGLLYTFDYKIFSPYVFTDLSYNIFDVKIFRTGGYVWTYDSFEEIPNEYKTKYQEENRPNKSIGISIGAGTKYHISTMIDLEIRYFFKYDSEIINTHHLLFGLSF